MAIVLVGSVDEFGAVVFFEGDAVEDGVGRILVLGVLVGVFLGLEPDEFVVGAVFVLISGAGVRSKIGVVFSAVAVLAFAVVFRFVHHGKVSGTTIFFICEK